jgi:ribosome biogenesis protein NSA1
VHNTSLTYLSHASGGVRPSHHILAGTRIGSVRRYDTRIARKPVADWQHVGRVGGVQRVQRGNFEQLVRTSLEIVFVTRAYYYSEAFIADHGGNLVALDLRTGRVLYAYAGTWFAIGVLSFS